MLLFGPFVEHFLRVDKQFSDCQFQNDSFAASSWRRHNNVFVYMKWIIQYLRTITTNRYFTWMKNIIENFRLNRVKCLDGREYWLEIWCWIRNKQIVLTIICFLRNTLVNTYEFRERNAYCPTWLQESMHVTGRKNRDSNAKPKRYDLTNDERENQ